ncbi:hypothetical protein [Nocardioides bruguierae]|uniref:Uncharacterized protein n=1 Tax=Nocardioides bruguierae TaxID=2945102 RepID=A0A9X2IEX3_9ACTN|nr:hypothetical protein [Nocardioides bruguierae]MCM0621276.1 hypothetical protein [Nocardioides bruguierae]
MADDLYLDPAAVTPLVERFRTLRQTLQNAQPGVVGHCGAVQRACGEFSGAVADGAEKYQIGWRAALDLTATSAGVVAGNINVEVIDVTRLDQDLADGFSLSPESGS